MRNKIKLIKLTFLFTISSFVFFSCQKDEETVTQQEIPAASLQQSDDGTEQTEATDNAIDISTQAFSGSNMRVAEGHKDDCNMTTKVDSVNRSMTFTFSGDNCARTRTRTGIIVAKVISDVKWHSKGGILEITFTNFKVTRKSDNKSIVINGTSLVYNNSGIANPLVETVHGDFTITFDNNTTREWKVSRKRSISFNDTVILVTVQSDSSNFITEVGINREGKSFITTIPNPVVIQNCGIGQNGYKAIKGEVVYTLTDGSLSIVLGYKSLSEKVEDCSATGSLVTYIDPTTIAKKYYPYK